MAELLTPFLGGAPLSAGQLKQLSQYLNLLLRWNAKINLTAVRDEEHIVTRHIGESVFAARHLFPAEAGQPGAVIDLGSGAGLPGVPLKIAVPEISLTLIESQNKKATFLKEVVRCLELEHVRVFNGRAEGFPDRAGLVTLRAVEHFEAVLPVAESLVAEGSERPGRIALLIGKAQVPVAHEILPALRWQEAIAIPQALARVLLIGTKQPGK